MVYAIKLARQDFSYYPPIRGLPGVLIAAVTRPAVMLVSDFGILAYARHPHEMGCAQWWFGRLWPWLLLVSAIVLGMLAPAELKATAALAELLGVNASGHLGANSTAAALEAILAVSNATLNATIFAGDDAQVALTSPAVLSAVSAMLLVPWLLSLVAFFRLSKRTF